LRAGERPIRRATDRDRAPSAWGISFGIRSDDSWAAEKSWRDFWRNAASARRAHESGWPSWNRYASQTVLLEDHYLLADTLYGIPKLRLIMTAFHFELARIGSFAFGDHDGAFVTARPLHRGHDLSLVAGADRNYRR
jgi:hypothetical protein